MHREVASSCARGASDRSMLRILGEIPFASSKREPFTRGNRRLWQRNVTKYQHGPEQLGGGGFNAAQLRRLPAIFRGMQRGFSGFQTAWRRERDSNPQYSFLTAPKR